MNKAKRKPTPLQIASAKLLDALTERDLIQTRIDLARADVAHALRESA